jgi:BclB C-terminal domain-containing protein
MKWSGEVSETSAGVTRNLADAGSNVESGVLVENRYPFCEQKTAICFAIRTLASNLSQDATVNFLHNGVIFASSPTPAAGATLTGTFVPSEIFAVGDDIEVQVVTAPGNDEGQTISLTVVVEFLGPAGTTGPTGPSGGPTGPTGPSGGPSGPTGPTGPSGGPAGPTGATGPAGSTTIIPFASGDIISVEHNILVAPDMGAVVAFGSSRNQIAIIGGNIDLSGAFGVASNMAFSMPRDGSLVQLSAFLTNDVALLNVPANTSVVVEIYRSATPDNVFSPTGVAVTIPIPAGLVAIGTVFSATAGPFAVAVNNQDRLILLARVTVTGVDIATSLTGYLSAGLSIA